MARRPGILRSIRLPAPAGESPNTYVGETSVEVRAHWTPLTPWGDVKRAIDACHKQAIIDARAQWLLTRTGPVVDEALGKVPE